MLPSVFRFLKFKKDENKIMIKSKVKNYSVKVSIELLK